MSASTRHRIDPLLRRAPLLPPPSSGDREACRGREAGFLVKRSRPVDIFPRRRPASRSDCPASPKADDRDANKTQRSSQHRPLCPSTSRRRQLEFASPLDGARFYVATCSPDISFLPHRQHEWLKQRKGCTGATARGRSWRIGLERQLGDKQEAEEGRAEAYHHDRVSRVGAFLSLSSCLPGLSSVVFPCRLVHPVPRQDMHIPLFVPRLEVHLVWYRAPMLGDRPGQVAGCGRSTAKGEKRRRRPIRQGRRHHSTPNAHSIHSTHIKRKSAPPAGAWAEEKQRFPAAALVVAPARCSSLQRHTTPPKTLLIPLLCPPLDSSRNNPPPTCANLTQPHDAHFASRYPRDPPLSPFAHPRLRLRPRAGAGATESKMRTMLHNKTRSPLLLCARPVSPPPIEGGMEGCHFLVGWAPC